MTADLKPRLVELTHRSRPNREIDDVLTRYIKETDIVLTRAMEIRGCETLNSLEGRTIYCSLSDLEYLMRESREPGAPFQVDAVLRDGRDPDYGVIFEEFSSPPFESAWEAVDYALDHAAQRRDELLTWCGYDHSALAEQPASGCAPPAQPNQPEGPPRLGAALSQASCPGQSAALVPGTAMGLHEESSLAQLTAAEHFLRLMRSAAVRQVLAHTLDGPMRESLDPLGQPCFAISAQDCTVKFSLSREQGKSPRVELRLSLPPRRGVAQIFEAPQVDAATGAGCVELIWSEQDGGKSLAKELAKLVVDEKPAREERALANRTRGLEIAYPAELIQIHEFEWEGRVFSVDLNHDPLEECVIRARSPTALGVRAQQLSRTMGLAGKSLTEVLQEESRVQTVEQAR